MTLNEKQKRHPKNHFRFTREHEGAKATNSSALRLKSKLQPTLKIS